MSSSHGRTSGRWSKAADPGRSLRRPTVRVPEALHSTLTGPWLPVCPASGFRGTIRLYVLVEPQHVVGVVFSLDFDQAGIVPPTAPANQPVTRIPQLVIIQRSNSANSRQDQLARRGRLIRVDALARGECCNREDGRAGAAPRPAARNSAGSCETPTSTMGHCFSLLPESQSSIQAIETEWADRHR